MKKKYRIVILCILLVILIAAWIVNANRERPEMVQWLDSPDGSYSFAFIVLDLDGNGIESTSVESGMLFDGNAIGWRCGTGWLAAEDGFLAFDRNNDGIINDGSELFGIKTVSYHNKGGFCSNPLEALAQEDSNKDRVVNAKDQNWQSLKVWRDLNQDGICQPNELFTLEVLGIKSFNLKKYKTNGQQYNANYHYGSGNYKTNDGKRNFCVVYFQGNPDISRFTERISVPHEIRYIIPNLRGAGAVRSLREACVLNSEIIDIVKEFDNAENDEERRIIMDNLLTAWAATSPLSKPVQERLDPKYRLRRVDNSRGPGKLFEVEPDFAAEWDRKIQVVEAFVGIYFFTTPNELPPNHKLQPGTYVENIDGQVYFVINYGAQRRGYLQEAYDLVFNHYYEQLKAASSRMK